MNLEEFIYGSIKEICNSIKKLDKEIPGVIPPEVYGQAIPQHKHIQNKLIEYIEFDVALTTDKREGKDALEIKVAGWGFGKSSGDSLGESSLSRIKFNIPFRFASIIDKNPKR